MWTTIAAIVILVFGIAIGVMAQTQADRKNLTWEQQWRAVQYITMEYSRMDADALLAELKAYMESPIDDLHEVGEELQAIIRMVIDECY